MMMSEMHTLHLSVERTARVLTLGGGSPALQSVWIACHGYGQLAAHFMRHFQSIASEERLIVAPEGLSRFYLSGTEGHIGASWMTREDRLSEIQDYIGYLDRLWEYLQSNYPIENAKITILGFSQGCATACRWVHHSPVPCQRLLLWGGGIPPDVVESDNSRLRKLPLTVVIGDNDPYLTPERVESELKKYAAAGFKIELCRFAGGHTIDKAVLETFIDL